MVVLPLLLLLFALIVGGVLVALLVRLIVRLSVRPPAGKALEDGEAGDLLRAVARRTAVLRWAGVLIGVIVAVVAARSGDLGTGLLMAAPLFGLCALIGVLVGELTVRRPHGPTRTATVEVRRIRDYLPRHLSRAVAAAGAVLLVLVTATTAASSPDDLGRPGRALTRHCTPEMVQSHGPWPGLFYTGRLMLVVLAGLLMAYVALRTIVRRPRSGGASGVAVDDALRRRAARVVTGAVGILIVIPLAGVSLTAAIGLLGFSCAPPWWTIAGWGLLALVTVSLAMVSWCAAAVLTPTDRTDSLARTR